MQALSEKQGLEVGALTEFVAALDILYGEHRFLFQELRSPPEPDALCSFDGYQLHVEVGHIYGTSTDAKELLGRQCKPAAKYEDLVRSASVPLDIKFVGALNNLLAGKAKKIYEADRIWLLIRSASPLWNIHDYKTELRNISMPQVHPFEKIWLLCGPRFSFGVLRLA